MAITALYRLTGGEVLKISPSGQTFADRNPAYWGVATDPTLPDGTTVRATRPDGRLGPLRVLGLAKIHVAGTVRNATAGEITAFATAEATDEAAQDAEDAVAQIQTHPRARKVLAALVKRIVSENNQQSQWINDFSAQVAFASNLADLKSRVASLGTLPIRTVAQAKAALISDVSPND